MRTTENNMRNYNLTFQQQIDEGTLHPALIAAYQAGLNGEPKCIGGLLPSGSVDCDELSAFHEGRNDLREKKLLDSHLEIAIKALELLDVEGKLLKEGQLRLGDSALLDRIADLAGDVRSHALASKWTFSQS